MSFDVNWDIDKYKEDHESEEHWMLRRNFMERWKPSYPEERLVCLARVFANIEFMGCRYPKEVMQEVARMSKEVTKNLNYRKVISFIDGETLAQRSRGIGSVWIRSKDNIQNNAYNDDFGIPFDQSISEIGKSTANFSLDSTRFRNSMEAMQDQGTTAYDGSYGTKPGLSQDQNMIKQSQCQHAGLESIPYYQESEPVQNSYEYSDYSQNYWSGFPVDEDRFSDQSIMYENTNNYYQNATSNIINNSEVRETMPLSIDKDNSTVDHAQSATGGLGVISGQVGKIKRGSQGRRYRYWLHVGLSDAEARVLSQTRLSKIPEYKQLKKTVGSCNRLRKSGKANMPMTSCDSTKEQLKSRIEIKQSPYSLMQNIIKNQLNMATKHVNNYTIPETTGTTTNKDIAIERSEVQKKLLSIGNASQSSNNTLNKAKPKLTKFKHIKRFKWWQQQGKSEDEAYLLCQIPMDQLPEYKEIMNRKGEEKKQMYKAMKEFQSQINEDTNIKMCDNVKKKIVNNSQAPNDSIEDGKPKLTKNKHFKRLKFWQRQGKTEEEAYLLCQIPMNQIPEYKDIRKKKLLEKYQRNKEKRKLLSKKNTIATKHKGNTQKANINSIGSKNTKPKIINPAATQNTNKRKFVNSTTTENTKKRKFVNSTSTGEAYQNTHPTVVIKDINKEIHQKEYIALQNSISKYANDEGIKILHCVNKSGCVVVTCADEYARDWLDKEIPTFVPWDKAQLTIINEGEIPQSLGRSSYDH